MRAFPSFGDHFHIVITVQFDIRTIPFRMPGEVRGVNIHCQAFSETMQLIRPDKMHIPGKTSPVSFCGKVMGKGWNLGRKLDCIVPRRNSAPAGVHSSSQNGKERKAEHWCRLHQKPPPAQPTGRCLGFSTRDDHMQQGIAERVDPPESLKSSVYGLP